jgi:hypothetical protein
MSRSMSLARHEAHTGEMRNAHNILIGKHEGKFYLGQPEMKGILILKLTLTL